MRKLKQIRADIKLATAALQQALEEANGLLSSRCRLQIRELRAEERMALLSQWSWEEVQLEAKRLGIPGYSLLARSKLEALITEAHS
jgi:hypothetical protein